MPKERGTDILIVGGFAGEGLAGSYGSAFEALGCHVVKFDYIGALSRWRPDSSFGSRLKAHAYLRAARPLVEAGLLKAVARWRPRLIFIIKCDDMHAGVYSLLRYAARGGKIFAFHPDDPFNRGRLFRPGPSHSRALAQMRSVDAYFLWASHLVEQAKQAGARRVEYLPFAADDDQYRPAPDDVSRTWDVSFVGNWDSHREAILQRFSGSRLRVAIFGNAYWRTRCSSSFVRSCWQGREATAADFSRIVAASKVCLNVLRRQNQRSHNMRTFEIPACRGAMLSDYSDEQARFFQPGKGAFYYESPDAMVALAEKLVADDRRLRDVRATAFECTKVHTYRHRAMHLLAAAGMTSARGNP